MQILAHRGYWKVIEEQNSEVAFRRSFEHGFGLETDIRDFNGELVISHDIPEQKCMTLERFFQIYCEYNKNLYLALNIKADGLQIKLKDLLLKYDIQNYFCFDMSIPDTLIYAKHNIKFFVRESEYEDYSNTPLYTHCNGIWSDLFHTDVVDNKNIEKHLNNNKKICFVSPELHKQNTKDLFMKQLNTILQHRNVMICSDL